MSDLPVVVQVTNAAGLTASANTILTVTTAAPGGWPGQPGNPVGYAACPAAAPSRWSSRSGSNAWPGAYPGQLSASSTIASGTANTPKVYAFQDFGGITITASYVIFVGCRFAASGTVNQRFDTGTHVSFFYCTYQPPVGTVQPHAAWPAAGAGTGLNRSSAGSNYSVSNASGYQYGVVGSVNAKFVDLFWDHCDMWGSANNFDFEGAPATGPVAIHDCWIHDCRFPGISPNWDHSDGVGYEGSDAGPPNFTLNHCTVASFGNTNGLAMQGTSWINTTITNNYLSGWDVLINMPYPPTYGPVNNLTFTGNVIGTDIVSNFWGPLHDVTGWVNGSGHGGLWRNNTIRVVPGYPLFNGLTAANNGWFLYPDSSIHATDYTLGP